MSRRLGDKPFASNPVDWGKLGGTGKMVTCKTCGAEIAKTAKRCPQCGARQHQVALTFVYLIVVFAVIAIVLVIAGGNQIGNSGSTSGPQATASSAPIVVSSSNLWAAYSENEVSADELYEDQFLSVTGTISSIGKDLLFETPYIALKTEDTLGLYTVQCFFSDESQIDRVSALRAGQVVTITGTCSGKYLNAVQIQDCSVTETYDS